MWLDWDPAPDQVELLEFTRMLLQLRRTEPVFRRRRFFQGRSIHGAGIKDLYWLKPDGGEMTDADWHAGHAHCLGMVLPGDQIEETGEQGERVSGDTFAILFNAHDEPVEFRLGARRRDIVWTTVFDTAAPGAPARSYPQMGIYPLHGRSLDELRAGLSNPTP